MEPIEIKEMDVKRFNALAAYTRSPLAAYISRELAWFSNPEETIIGVLLLDTVDNDYAAIVLGRDEGKRFRAFDMTVSLSTVKEAKDWLIGAIKWHTVNGSKIFEQGDGQKGGIDLFTPVVPAERQHPYFINLNSHPAFLSAKEIINEMMPHFIDVDGNFVEQFQSTAFDSRLWELYLNAYFTEEKLVVERKHEAPDFIVGGHGYQPVAIEAVIVGRKQSNPPKYFREYVLPQLPENFLEDYQNKMAIRFGSPLYSKLRKKYWDLPHIKNNPLVFAIADFYDDQSMLWSQTPLITYLYGVAHKFHYDKNGQLVITPLKIASHKAGGKEIPSGYFFQPESENVSAVLFSTSGTISKFNRLGKQAGFGDPRIIMIRQGACHDPDSNAALPKPFRYEVNEKSNETWAEGLSMFHNPNALQPLQKELFPSIAHHFLENGQLVSYLPKFHPYASLTFNIRPTDD